MPSAKLLSREKISNQSLTSIVEKSQEQENKESFQEYELKLTSSQLELIPIGSGSISKSSGFVKPISPDEGFESDIDTVSIISSDDSFASSTCMVEDHVLKHRENDSANGSSSDSEQEILPKKGPSSEVYSFIEVLCYTDVKFPNVLLFCIKDTVLVFNFENVDILHQFYTSFNTLKAVTNQRTYVKNLSTKFNLLHRTDQNGVTHIEISRETSPNPGTFQNDVETNPQVPKTISSRLDPIGKQLENTSNGPKAISNISKPISNNPKAISNRSETIGNAPKIISYLENGSLGPKTGSYLEIGSLGSKTGSRLENGSIGPKTGSYLENGSIGPKTGSYLENGSIGSKTGSYVENGSLGSKTVSNRSDIGNVTLDNSSQVPKNLTSNRLESSVLENTVPFHVPKVQGIFTKQEPVSKSFFSRLESKISQIPEVKKAETLRFYREKTPEKPQLKSYDDSRVILQGELKSRSEFFPSNGLPPFTLHSRKLEDSHDDGALRKVWKSAEDLLEVPKRPERTKRKQKGKAPPPPVQDKNILKGQFVRVSVDPKRTIEKPKLVEEVSSTFQNFGSNLQTFSPNWINVRTPEKRTFQKFGDYKKCDTLTKNSSSNWTNSVPRLLRKPRSRSETRNQTPMAYRYIDTTRNLPVPQSQNYSNSNNSTSTISNRLFGLSQKLKEFSSNVVQNSPSRNFYPDNSERRNSLGEMTYKFGNDLNLKSVIKKDDRKGRNEKKVTFSAYATVQVV